MKVFLGSCAIGSIMLGLPTWARATGITYDCDTAVAHFSDLVLPAPTGPFTVTGKVQVNQIAQDNKWAPTARLRIGSAEPSPGGAPDDYAGIELTALPGKALSVSTETVQALGFDVKGQKREIIRSSFGPTGAAQPFRLTYNSRSVAVSVGNESRTYPLKASAPVVEIVCSTGEFLFTDLVISTGR